MRRNPNDRGGSRTKIHTHESIDTTALAKQPEYGLQELVLMLLVMLLHISHAWNILTI